MRKESCFFPQSASFPSFSQKCNALPHKSSPIYMKARILPPSKCKTHTKYFPTNSYFSCYFYLRYLLLLFCFFVSFHFIIIPFEFSVFLPFFSPKLWILPQSGKIWKCAKNGTTHKCTIMTLYKSMLTGNFGVIYVAVYGLKCEFAYL